MAGATGRQAQQKSAHHTEQDTMLPDHLKFEKQSNYYKMLLGIFLKFQIICKLSKIDISSNYKNCAKLEIRTRCQRGFSWEL